MKHPGPSWFKRLLVRLIPDPTIQRLRKAIFDIEAESRNIVLEKAVAMKGICQDHENAEGEDLMSILRMLFFSLVLPLF